MSGDYEINPLRYNPHSASSRIHRIILVEVKSFVSNYKNTVLLLKKYFFLLVFLKLRTDAEGLGKTARKNQFFKCVRKVEKRTRDSYSAF